MIITVEVKPNARESNIRSWKDRGTVIVDIKAPPVDGKANQELIKFLSKAWNVPKTHIEIVRGQGSRVKHVRVPDETQIKRQG